MDNKHLHVYWMQGTFRWALVVTRMSALNPKYYNNPYFIDIELSISPPTFNLLNKEQSFDFIKNKNFITTIYISYNRAEVLHIDKPNLEEYIFAMKIYKSIRHTLERNKEYEYSVVSYNSVPILR